jgi:nucleotide-binding universal stress UspA family protein
MPTATRRLRSHVPRHRRTKATPPASHAAARRVLLALDGSRPAKAAMRFARRMAERGAWAPEALTVTEPLPTYVGDIVLPSPVIPHDLMTGNVLLGLKSQLRRHGLPTWGAHVRIGPTVHSIVEMSRDGRFDMVVLGLGQHGRLARLFGAETACRVAAHSPVPTLAVHGSVRGLTTVAVVAVDFSAASDRAAREALSMLEPGGKLHLVHVITPFNFTPMADHVWRREYDAAVERSFANLIERLGVEPERVTTKLLNGVVVDTIERYAQSVGADLIAAGSHSAGLVERLMIGSTPAQLLRTARRSVLIAPPSVSDSSATR